MNTNYQDLFDQLGLTDLSEEEKNKRIAEMQEVLDQRIFLRMMNMLSEADRDLFDTLEKDEDIDKFLAEKGINPEELAFEEATAYREELIQNMAYMMGKMDK